MKSFKLNTGYDIPLVGLGTYLIKGTDLTPRVLDDALSAGYRLFDSAHMYGNEQYLGNAFQELLPKHNLTREDIFITTKFVPTTSMKTEKDFLEVVQESLKNFKTDYIDMMLLHWPGVYGISDRSKDVVKYRHAAWRALIKFKEQGLIRSIGVSNFLVRHLEALNKEFDVLPAINQVEYHPMCYDLDLLDYCKKKRILLQAYSSLGTSSTVTLRDHKLVKQISTDLHKSSSQILLRWAYQRNVGVIPKARSRRHLEENMDLNFEIPSDKMALLDDLKNTSFTRIDWDPNDVV